MSFQSDFDKLPFQSKRNTLHLYKHIRRKFPNIPVGDVRIALHTSIILRLNREAKK